MSSVVARLMDEVLVLTLDRPPVNALDAATLDELSQRLTDAADEAQAVILTGSGKIFSAGADLQRVLQASPDEIDEGIDALNRCFRNMFTFPRPLVAAVNGHALAGGCVLTCGCDYRLMAAGSSRIGAVEHLAGVPFPAWALELVRTGVNNQHLNEIVLKGTAFSADDGLAAGLIDEIVTPDDLLRRAIQIAKELARIPTRTYELTKTMLRRERVEAADALAAATDADVKQAWRSPEVLGAVRRQMQSLRS